jgi:hypothetical protein
VVDVDRRGAFLVGCSTARRRDAHADRPVRRGRRLRDRRDRRRRARGVRGGLVLTDLGVAAAWLSGVLGSRRPRVQLALGRVTGVASLGLGVLILTGQRRRPAADRLTRRGCARRHSCVCDRCAHGGEGQHRDVRSRP